MTLDARPWVLPTVSRAAAEVSQRLGVGRSLAFQSSKGPATLTLLPCTTAPVTGPWQPLHTRAGILYLADTGPLVTALGDLPAVLDATAQAWYRELLIEQFAAPIHQTWGPLALAPSLGELPAEADLRLHCLVQAERTRVACQAACTVSTASALLAPLAAPVGLRHLPPTLRLYAPVVLGQVTVTPRMLGALAPGDVLLLDTALTPDGEGSIDVFGHRWRCHAERPGQPLDFVYAEVLADE